MKPESKKLFAEEISNYLGYIGWWSPTGFQKFLGSSVISLIIEAVRAGKPAVFPEKSFMRLTNVTPCLSKDMGKVSCGQLMKFITIIPADVAEKEEFWKGLRIWSCYSGWWDEHEPSWEELDEWRVEMGLERLNPLMTDGELTVIFRKMGHRSVPEEISGYKIAACYELKQVGLTAEALDNIPDRLSVVIKEKGCWRLVRPDVSGGLCTIPVVNPIRAFHNSVVFVPLIKL